MELPDIPLQNLQQLDQNTKQKHLEATKDQQRAVPTKSYIVSSQIFHS